MDRIAQYSTSHQNQINRACHLVGIPIIVFSLLLTPLITWHLHLWTVPIWMVAAILFAVGWIFQFVGHAFEGSPPEFLKDWRFLFVGVRWWFAKVTGRA